VKSVTFEEALKYELSTITGMDKKVFPSVVKEGVKPPYVIYVSSEGVYDKTLSGYLDTKEIECEIHVIHTDYGVMKTLTKEVLTKLLTFYGRSIGINGVFIKSFTYDKPEEAFEEEVGFHRSSFGFRVRI
jgi:hypothetical protein